MLSALSADLIVTVVSSQVIFFDFSNFALIHFAAVAAHVPFSISATVLFLKPRSVLIHEWENLAVVCSCREYELSIAETVLD